jgi:hypothetical protein
MLLVISVSLYLSNTWNRVVGRYADKDWPSTQVFVSFANPTGRWRLTQREGSGQGALKPLPAYALTVLNG